MVCGVLCREDEDFDPFLPQPPPPPPPHLLPHHMDENAWKWYCLGHQSSQKPAQAAETPESPQTSDMVEKSTQPSNGVQSAETAVAAQDSTQDMLDNDADSSSHQVQTHSLGAHVIADTDMQAAGENRDAAMDSESMTEAKHTTPQGMAPQMAVLASLDQVCLACNRPSLHLSLLDLI